MPIKPLLVALALVAGLAPGIAAAQQGCGHADRAAASCAEGTTWDAASRSCVTVGS